MKKILLFSLILALLLPLVGCHREEQIPETPLRALTYFESFAYECIMPFKQEIYETRDLDMQTYREYTREDAEPTRILQIFDREWELRYEKTRHIPLTDFDADVYITEGDPNMEVRYLTGTEQLFSIRFASNDMVAFGKPENFTPDEAGLLAYTCNICAHLGVDTSDYIVEYNMDGYWKRVTLKKYLQSFETVYDVSFSFTEEGNLSYLCLPSPGWGTAVVKAQDLALFTDGNIINAVKHRIVPYLEDGTRLISAEIGAKYFFFMEGRLYLWVKMDFAYKKSFFYIDRTSKEPSNSSFSSNFVIAIP